MKKKFRLMNIVIRENTVPIEKILVNDTFMIVGDIWVMLSKDEEKRQVKALRLSSGVLTILVDPHLTFGLEVTPVIIDEITVKQCQLRTK